MHIEHMPQTRNGFILKVECSFARAGKFDEHTFEVKPYPFNCSHTYLFSFSFLIILYQNFRKNSNLKAADLNQPPLLPTNIYIYNSTYGANIVYFCHTNWGFQYGSITEITRCYTDISILITHISAFINIAARYI